MGFELEAIAAKGTPSTLEMPPLPNYVDAGVSNVVPAVFLNLARSHGFLYGRSVGEIEERVHSINAGMTPDLDSWFPKEARSASQIVVFVLDGLGVRQLKRFAVNIPSLVMFDLKEISSVAPTTTATALTSICTGAVPSTHGILGYRMALGRGQVFNTLSWSTKSNPVGVPPKPEVIQPIPPFLDLSPRVVTKAQYQGSGFTKAHLRRTDVFDYRLPSTMVDHVGELLRSGEPFVYAYYEGIDTVAHEYGLHACYEEELREVDYLLGRLVAVLPAGTLLIVTSDHGQVEVPRPPIELDRTILDSTSMLSGEGRFRWLHLRSGAIAKVADLSKQLYGDVAWVLTKEELVEGGYFGSPTMTKSEFSRLGDLALISKTDVAFYDPLDTGPYNLVCRHGSLTDEELLVPLLSCLA